MKKKKNIDEETERLIEQCYHAMESDEESPQTQALIEELKRRNPADVPAITRDACERIIALNKATEKYPGNIHFNMLFFRDLITLSVSGDYAEAICEKDKTMPRDGGCDYKYYWLNKYVEDEPDYFLTKWEKHFGLTNATTIVNSANGREHRQIKRKAMYRKYRSRQTGVPKASELRPIITTDDKLTDEYEEHTEETEVTKKGLFSSFIDFDKRVFRSREMRLSFFYGSLITLGAISLGQLLAKLI